MSEMTGQFAAAHLVRYGAGGFETREGCLSAIGNTPLVRLSRLVDSECAEVWVKLEGANPTGSHKDRAAIAMIEAAESDGRLKPGQTVVEYTGGSTGSSLALVCAVKGYPLHIISSDAFSTAKIRTMQAFGATIELISGPSGMTAVLTGDHQAHTTSRVVASDIDRPS
jgi:cysteine synthase A